MVLVKEHPSFALSCLSISGFPLLCDFYVRVRAFPDRDKNPSFDGLLYLMTQLFDRPTDKFVVFSRFLSMAEVDFWFIYV